MTTGWLVVLIVWMFGANVWHWAPPPTLAWLLLFPFWLQDSWDASRRRGKF